MSEEKVSHDIDGIGSIRAGQGTALETIAGAANFWQTKAKTSWKDGFLTGSISITIIATLVFGVIKCLY